jgi:hypothetical protein
MAESWPGWGSGPTPRKRKPRGPYRTGGNCCYTENGMEKVSVKWRGLSLHGSLLLRLSPPFLLQ